MDLGLNALGVTGVAVLDDAVVGRGDVAVAVGDVDDGDGRFPRGVDAVESQTFGVRLPTNTYPSPATLYLPGN